MIEISGMSLVRCFGTLWKRDAVLWTAVPRILGKQSTSAPPIDFHDQVGVYILYDRRDLIYVGCSDKMRPLGTRLYEHTLDRLSGQWDRFSWFGFAPVSGGGQEAEARPNSLNAVIGTVEAVLLANFRPWQNKVGADDLSVSIEYLQAKAAQYASDACRCYSG